MQARVRQRQQLALPNSTVVIQYVQINGSVGVTLLLTNTAHSRFGIEQSQQQLLWPQRGLHQEHLIQIGICAFITPWRALVQPAFS